MLTADQTKRFSEEGYLLAQGLFEEADLAPLRSEYGGVLDQLCALLVKQGKLEHDYAELPFADRFLAVCRETGAVYAQFFNFVLPHKGVNSATPIWLGDAVFNMLRHPRIIDAVESLIGPEIAFSPVGNVRIKPPERLIGNSGGERRRGLFGATPWHQDNGVVTEEADDTEMITVWFPLTPAPETAGCLQLVPRSHEDGIICHCPDSGGELSIPQKLMPKEEAVSVPMMPGDVLFLHRRTLHAALPNVGDSVRWSFDLRYMPVGAASGREAFPSFVVRSRKDPGEVVKDPEQWRERWQEARLRLMGGHGPSKWNRWSSDAAMCA